MGDYYDDIMLEYDLFLAEQELYENLISLGGQVYHENCGLILIKEDYDNKVNTYIEKVVGGLQKAWNNFKTKVVDANIKPYLNSIKDKYTKWSSENHEIIVENWHSYNWATFDTINTVPYDIEKLNAAQNKEEYYSNVYGSFYTDKDKSLKDNIINKVMNTEPKHIINSQDVNQAFTFCTQEFFNKVNKLQNNIKDFNSQIVVLKQSINVTSSGEQQSTTYQLKAPAQNNNQAAANNNGGQQATGESVNMTLLSLYESVLMEADEDNNKAMKVVSNTNSDNDGSQTGQNNNIKKMTMYITGNIDVMSAKMKILRNALFDCVASILKQALPPKKDEEGNTVEQPEEVEVSANQQVEI